MPVVGVEGARRPVTTHDKLTIGIALRRTIDDLLGNRVRIRVWWRPGLNPPDAHGPTWGFTRHVQRKTCVRGRSAAHVGPCRAQGRPGYPKGCRGRPGGAPDRVDLAMRDRSLVHQPAGPVKVALLWISGLADGYRAEVSAHPPPDAFMRFWTLCF